MIFNILTQFFNIFTQVYAQYFFRKSKKMNEKHKKHDIIHIHVYTTIEQKSDKYILLYLYNNSFKIIR